MNGEPIKHPHVEGTSNRVPLGIGLAPAAASDRDFDTPNFSEAADVDVHNNDKKTSQPNHDYHHEDLLAALTAAADEGLLLCGRPPRADSPQEFDTTSSAIFFFSILSRSGRPRRTGRRLSPSQKEAKD